MLCCCSGQPFYLLSASVFVAAAPRTKSRILCCLSPELFSRFCHVKSVCLSVSGPAGGGLVHVGVMLRAAERGDGHGHRAGAAAGLRSGSGALPLRPQRRVLHLPPHQLRERRSAVQGLRSGLLCLQTQGKPSVCVCVWGGVVRLTVSSRLNYVTPACACEQRVLGSVEATESLQPTTAWMLQLHSDSI